MSSAKNHKRAIQAIIEAHETKGKMREIMLQILADQPSAIVNAWEKIQPVIKVKLGVCQGCNNPHSIYLFDGLCKTCHEAKQS